LISPIPSLAIAAHSIACAAGLGRAALLEALREQRTGLRPNDFGRQPLACWIGRVEGVETLDFPIEFAALDCRNNRLAWLALRQDGFLNAARDAIARHGADRVALVLGTSTASIGATEEAYQRLDSQGRFPPELANPVLHSPHSLVVFVQSLLELQGPAFTVATACSSSAKVFAQAERLIRHGVVDAAIVGGVDSLCNSVLYGFNSLELVSPEPCRPFDARRRGISIGESAGFALLEKVSAAPNAPRLIGWGESSDAHHMSSPHPDGLGARMAMADAMARAGLSASQVDYINLHGTATPKNDEIEAQVIADLFPASTLASSTKGWTGHTLGAAGITEAAITLAALQYGLVPGTLNSSQPDAHCGPQVVFENQARPLRVALSNSFGFGGNNACLAFARGA
jgi:3-oxoacyl-[acyl-carrier-protein] synthase-1